MPLPSQPLSPPYLQVLAYLVRPPSFGPAFYHAGPAIRVREHKPELRDGLLGDGHEAGVQVGACGIRELEMR